MCQSGVRGAARNDLIDQLRQVGGFVPGWHDDRQDRELALVQYTVVNRGPRMARTFIIRSPERRNLFGLH